MDSMQIIEYRFDALPIGTKVFELTNGRVREYTISKIIFTVWKSGIKEIMYQVSDENDRWAFDGSGSREWYFTKAELLASL